MLSALQRSLIFPGAATQGRAEAIVRAEPGIELIELRSGDGEKIAALFAPAAGKARGSILWAYGNGMCMAACGAEVEQFRKLGLNVMVGEYIGYGMSGGRASEAGVYETAEAAYGHLRLRGDVDPTRIIVAGWSLGAAAAIELASRRPGEVAGLMIFSAFTSMSDIARRVLPWAPLSLLEHRFENEKKIAAVTCPILIVHGQRDSIIPYEMSLKLKSAAMRAEHVCIDEADHNDLFDVGRARIDAAVDRFATRVLGG